jgi:hypothetical protein
MSNFKPQVTFMTKESLRDWRNDYSYKPKSKYITVCYKTYRELLKNIKQHCIDNIDDDGVFVVRSKRGEWGEWFERWSWNGTGAYITKQGWS